MTTPNHGRQNRGSSAKSHRRHRAARLVALAATFLTFGITPLSTAPAAQADDFDLSDLLDPSAWVTPWDGIDWGSFFSPAAWDAVFGNLGDLSTLSEPQPAGALAGDDWSGQLVYQPVPVGVADWINSDLGQQVDNAINQAAGLHLIGTGGEGAGNGGSGGDAGWLFGDGGNAGAAGDGGDAAAAAFTAPIGGAPGAP
jgi:hypothetical protein